MFFLKKKGDSRCHQKDRNYSVTSKEVFKELKGQSLLFFRKECGYHRCKLLSLQAISMENQEKPPKFPYGDLLFKFLSNQAIFQKLILVKFSYRDGLAAVAIIKLGLSRR